MSFLFARNKPKTPQEVVYALNELVLRPDLGNDPKLLEEVHRLLAQVRIIAHGEPDAPADPNQMSALSKEVYATNLLLPLTENLAVMSFDGRRDVTMLYTFLLQRQSGAHSPTYEYLMQHKVIVDMLFAAAGQPDIHRNANSILCEFARQEPLLTYILGTQSFWLLFSHCLEQEFEIASDCFTTLARFMGSVTKLTIKFLHENGVKFKNTVNQMMVCDSYVIRRQAIRLQASIINQRKNKEYISLYVNDLENLKIVMRLLRDKFKSIAYEAFHLFKVFVANPQKPQPIYDVLLRNKVKLLERMDDLKECERKEDELFKQERLYVYKRIAELTPREH